MNNETIKHVTGSEQGERPQDTPRFLLTWLIWYERVVVVLGFFFLGVYALLKSPASAIVGAFLLVFTWPMLRYGIRSARRYRFGAGVAALTVSLWVLALLVATRGSMTLAAMVFPAVLPVVVALPYLSRKHVLYLTIGAIAVCLAIGIIAALGPFLPSNLPDALLGKIMIPIAGATSGLTLIALWQVGTALRESLASAEATSEALMQSEKQLERKVESRTAELQSKNTELEYALAETSGVDRIAQAAISSLNPESVLDTLATVLHGVFPFNGVSVVLLDEERKNLVIEYTSGPGVLDGTLVHDHAHNRIPMSERTSAFTHVVKKNQPFFLGDITKEVVATMSPSDRWFHDSWHPISLLICPLAIQNEVTGVILFANSQERIKLSRAEISRIRRYLNPFASAIQSARLFEEAQTARAAAEEANQAKSQFLAMVSHEIRTPLNGVIGLTTLALADDLAPVQRKYLSDALDSAESLLAIINSVLDFSKIEAGRMELESVEFQLDRVLDQVARVAGAAATHKGLEFVMRIGDDVPPLLIGDPTRLGQAILNLVSNAVKFTEQGEILLQVGLSDSGGDDVEVEVSVRDTGLGIEPAVQEQLFAPFRQADESTTRKFGGTGLGLSITKNLIELMGGNIGVDSEPGKGSAFTFRVRLGIARSDPARRSLDARSKLRALVVDDNESARDVMSGYLRNFSISNDIAKDAAEALDLAEANRYDLILTDWRMPGTDGIQLIKTLRANPAMADTRVVLVTGYGGDQERNDASDAGADGFLNKPIRPSTLLDTLQSLFQDRDQPAPTAVRLPSSRGMYTGVNVLIVEDNHINQEILVGLLGRAGIDTQVAGDGRIGVDAVRTARQPFDLVLMDVQMPNMDGFDATRAIRVDGAELPIIGVTAHALDESRAQCLAAGMNDVITKPIHPDTVFETIDRWLRPDAHAAARGDGPALEIETPASDEPIFLIAGIDTADGLARAADNEVLYRELVQRFVEDHTAAAQEIRGLLEERRDDEARRRAHTLKGVAGNLGAKQVQRLADGIHAALPADNEQLEPLLGELEQALAEIAADFKRNAPVADATPDATPRHVDLQRLRALIEDSDANALDYLMEVRGALAATHGATLIDGLHEALKSYDFERALDALHRLEV